MRIGVVGSRTFKEVEHFKILCQVLASYTDVDEIVSGGAKGADSLAALYAQFENVKLTEFLPKQGNFAARNLQIVQNCDLLLAFWDGKSPGTKMTIGMAERAGIPVQVIEF